MSLSLLKRTYVTQCLCLKDDDNIDSMHAPGKSLLPKDIYIGEANYGQSDTPKEKDETLDQMAQAVKAL